MEEQGIDGDQECPDIFMKSKFICSFSEAGNKKYTKH